MVSSLLSLLHFCWAEGLDIKAHHPELWGSVLRIWVNHVEHQSKIDEAIHTMKMSSRGSIRKAVNVIQTVVMIQNLYSHGLTDVGVFVRKWNQSCARASQIIGRKATSLKFLFEITPKDTEHTMCWLLVCFDFNAWSFFSC